MTDRSVVRGIKYFFALFILKLVNKNRKVMHFKNYSDYVRVLSSSQKTSATTYAYKKNIDHVQKKILPRIPIGVERGNKKRPEKKTN